MARRRPSLIFYGPQIFPAPARPNVEAVNAEIEQRPNQIQAKWDQLARFSSPLVKNLVARQANDLERLEMQNPERPAGRELFRKISSDAQLGQGINITNPAPETPEPTDICPGEGRYAIVAPQRTHQMWTRSQEKARKEKFGTTDQVILE